MQEVRLCDKNRKKLLETNMFDLLVKINDGMLAGYDCIMDVFDESQESVAERCGKNKAKIDYPYFPDTYCWVRCYECWCTTSAFKTPEEAVEAWNRRANEIAMRRAEN